MAISYSVSYTFSPSTTISSSQVNQNFTDNANVWTGLEAKTKTFSNLGIDTELKSLGVISSADGLVGTPGFTFTSDTNCGIYRIGSDNIGLVTAGAKAINIASGGQVTYPLQPAFLAQGTPTISNVTGDGTDWTASFDSEIYDQGSNYNNSTFTFTAPVTGRYLFCANLVISGWGVGHTTVNMRLVTSNRNYVLSFQPNLGGFADTSGFGESMTVVADMDASDTAVISLIVSGSTKTVDIVANAQNACFSGYLAC